MCAINTERNDEVGSEKKGLPKLRKRPERTEEKERHSEADEGERSRYSSPFWNVCAVGSSWLGMAHSLRIPANDSPSLD